MNSPVDKTALSYWFPLIEAAGVPVPRTKIIKMPKDVAEDIWAAFDGEGDGKPLVRFAEEVSAQSAEFGAPLFLRTDYTAGKHSWSRTCFVPDLSASTIAQHILNLAEFSRCVGFTGLPWDTLVVREMLPTIPLGTCPHYDDMPICREFRFFVVDDGAVRCWHPYWPLESLEQGGAPPELDYDALCQTGDDGPTLRDLAERAGRAVGGSWSIDILETRRGWFITDMAEAEKSFHWEGCSHAPIELEI